MFNYKQFVPVYSIYVSPIETIFSGSKLRFVEAPFIVQLKAVIILFALYYGSVPLRICGLVSSAAVVLVMKL